jgi:predicted dehydrogenase
MRSGQLKVKELITHRLPFENAPQAYASILSDPGALGIILEYSGRAEPKPTISLAAAAAAPTGKCAVALIGAGNFSKMVLAPMLARSAARLKYIVESANSAAAAHLARKYGFAQVTSDLNAVLNDPEVKAVFIATNHDSHAALAEKALAAGKQVMVEKPLAIDLAGLKQVVDAVRAHPEQRLLVGFNRRFSPYVRKMKALLAGRSEPLAMTMTINAGIIPADVWVHDPVRGGGRIIGEACHFIDLLVHLAGSKVVAVAAEQMSGRLPVRDDKLAMVLAFADGSVGSLNYFGNGNKAHPKETLEVYSEGRILRLDNFRRLTGSGFRGFRRFGTWQMDKGHRAEVAEFVGMVEHGGRPLIPFAELVNVTLASFAAVTSAREGRRIELAREYGELNVS